MKHRRRRIDRLYERRSGYWSVLAVPYLCVPTEADIPAALASLPAGVVGPVKVYVGPGACPDEWDEDDEARTTITTTAT